MSYLPHTEEDRRKMLDLLGLEEMEDLLRDVPESVRFSGNLPLPPPLCQQEVEEELDRMALQNSAAARREAFLGGGVYDHYVPPLVPATLSRPEFYSAYTPYQAEASQGTLQAMFEFQSLLCRLTGMPFANASMYDGATALVEGVWMAASEAKGRTEVIVPRGMNPRYRAVLRAHLGSGPLTVREIDYDRSGRIDLQVLRDVLSERVAVVAAQNPNYFGHLEETAAVAEQAWKAGAFFLQVFEPVSLALIRTRGEVGADVAVGEGQSLGSAMNFGGPLIGLFTATERFLRKMPGRLAGLTEDAEGRRAFSLALQTREQHIRRGRATSNICTNQQLLSVAALVHLASLGPSGLRRSALLTQERALLLRRLLKDAGAVLPFDTPFFREFVVRLPRGLEACLEEAGIVPGIPLEGAYPELGDAFLVSVTEKRSVESLQRYAGLVADYLNRGGQEDHGASRSL